MYNRLTADAGTYFLTTTTAHTGLNLAMIRINTDAVFTTLTITNADGTTTNGLTSQNLSGATVAAGSIIACAQSERITAVTLSSGTAIGVKRS